eukprot:SAG31_NODE_3234_length_4512_cov_8.459325_3_plen_306_part_01
MLNLLLAGLLLIGRAVGQQSTCAEAECSACANGFFTAPSDTQTTGVNSTEACRAGGLCCPSCNAQAGCSSQIANEEHPCVTFERLLITSSSMGENSTVVVDLSASGVFVQALFVSGVATNGTDSASGNYAGPRFAEHDFTSSPENLTVSVDGGEWQTIEVAGNCDTASNCASLISTISGATVSTTGYSHEWFCAAAANGHFVDSAGIVSPCAIQAGCVAEGAERNATCVDGAAADTRSATKNELSCTAPSNGFFVDADGVVAACVAQTGCSSDGAERNATCVDGAAADTRSATKNELSCTAPSNGF